MGELVYQLLLPRSLVDSYRTGFDIGGGFAVDAHELQGVEDFAGLVRLSGGGMEGTPYPEHELFILRLPASPFVRARKAVGPLHPHSLLGGIVETGDFDGSGLTHWGESHVAHLLWIEPTRLVPGSELWQLRPKAQESQGYVSHHLATYHGLAWGWEFGATHGGETYGTEGDAPTQTDDSTPAEDQTSKRNFIAAPPSIFTGPVLRRPWGIVAADVHTRGNQLHAATLVAPQLPQNEEGFELLASGLWAKRIEPKRACVSEAATESENEAAAAGERAGESEIFEYSLFARDRGIPVRILRILNMGTPSQSTQRDGNGDVKEPRRVNVSMEPSTQGSSSQLMAYVTPLLVDAPLAQALGYTRLTQGVFTALRPLAELAEQSVCKWIPQRWDVHDLVSVESEKELSTSTPDLLSTLALLLAHVAPTGWEEIDLHIHMKGERRIRFAARARVGKGGAHATPADTQAAQTLTGEDAYIPIPRLPTAAFHVLEALRQNLTQPERGAPTDLSFEFGTTGHVDVNLRFDEEK